MKRRLLIGLVIGLHGVVAVCCVLWNAAGGPPSRFIDLLPVPVAEAQGSLLGIWAAFSGKGTAWRFAGAVAAITIVTLLLDRSLPLFKASSLGDRLLIQFVGSSAPLLLLRFLGMAVGQPSVDGADSQPFRWHFSLRSMLEWTAAVAVLCSMLKTMPERFRSQFVWGGFAIVASGIEAGIAVAAPWIALGTRWLAIRAVLLGLLAATYVSLCLAVSLNVFEAAISVAIHVAAYVMCLVGSLYSFRLLGYRLIWQRSVQL